MSRTGFYRPHPRVKYTGEVVDPVTGEITSPPSLTKQSFKAECDINNIIKAFSTTGMLNHVNQMAAQGMYADLPDGCEFQDALNTVEAARASFMTLPSRIRDRFGSDPQSFLSWLADPINQAEARELGLLNPKASYPAEQSGPQAGQTVADPVSA